MTLGGLYEPPIGNLRTSGLKLQGHGGGGFFNLFAAGAKAWGPLGIEGNMGFNLATDDKHDSSIFHYAGHTDYQLADRLFGVVELNGFTVIDNGQRTLANFEGVDLVNFGSVNAGTVITAAFGIRYQLTDKILIGAAYERPITHHPRLAGLCRPGASLLSRSGYAAVGRLSSASWPSCNFWMCPDCLLSGV